MKKVYFVIAVALAALLMISMAFAEYSSGELSFTLSNNRTFYYKNAITDNRNDAYAKTYGGTSTYNSVSATFYWVDYYNDTMGHSSDALSSSIRAQIDAPHLQNTMKYYKVISDHGGSYNGESFTHTGVTTTIQ